MSEGAVPFWKAKPLDGLTAAEWESLCDGCGKCCLLKLEDEVTGEVYPTNVACKLLDPQTCRCRHYRERRRHVPDCITLRPETVLTYRWLPRTCAYRLVAEGRDLPGWHPLVSGRADSVHEAGISVRGRVISETEAGDIEDHMVDWKL